MLSREDQELMTRVGPGTPCGELFRRYWLPVCPASELTAQNPKKRVRILGEDLVAFRDGRGRYGLVEARCRHRKTQLYFGFVEDDGLRCAYHGWKYDVTGQCIEQPFEPTNSPLRKEACLRAYPVQQLAGILFCYMGPKPMPLLPRYETLVRQDGTREVSVLPLHKCNWLQAQENAVDTVHTYYLHGHMLKLQGLLSDKEGGYYYRPIEKYDFEVVNEPAWSGIRKIRHYGGDRPEKERGHPAIFPNMLLVPQGTKLVMHFRVPVDDEHTYIIWSEFSPSEDGAVVHQREEDIPVNYFTDWVQPDGSYDLTTFMRHDQMAWETQGRVYDRTEELLGVSDRGIVMLRNQLKQQILAVQQGKEPLGVVRDPKLNEMINFTLSDGQARMARAAMRAEAAAVAE
jgi:5,5'-dehydrodivanillate O-demethylase